MACFICKYLGKQCTVSVNRIKCLITEYLQKCETTFEQNIKIKVFLTRKSMTISAVSVYLSYPLGLKKKKKVHLTPIVPYSKYR